MSSLKRHARLRHELVALVCIAALGAGFVVVSNQPADAEEAVQVGAVPEPIEPAAGLLHFRRTLTALRLWHNPRT